jgi:hypothetical protein
MAQIISLTEFRDALVRQTATAASPAMSPESGLGASIVAWWTLTRSLEAVTWETLALAGPAAPARGHPETYDCDAAAAIVPWQC